MGFTDQNIRGSEKNISLDTNAQLKEFSKAKELNKNASLCHNSDIKKRLSEYEDVAKKSCDYFSAMLASSRNEVGVNGVLESHYACCLDTGRFDLSLEETFRPRTFNKSRDAPNLDVKVSLDSHSPKIPSDQPCKLGAQIDQQMLGKMIAQKTAEILCKSREEIASCDAKAAERIGEIEQKFSAKYCKEEGGKPSAEGQVHFIAEVNIVANDLSKDSEDSKIYRLGRKMIPIVIDDFAKQTKDKLEECVKESALNQADFASDIIKGFTISPNCMEETVSKPFVHISIRRVNGIAQQICSKVHKEEGAKEEKYEMREMSTIQKGKKEGNKKEESIFYKTKT